MGWDYQAYAEKAKWDIRKNILLATVSKVFNFPIKGNMSGESKYDENCVALSKLIYYIHILRDHMENEYDNRLNVIQLSKMKDDFGQLQEINKCITTLFSAQRTTNKYCRLKVKLNVLRFESRLNGVDDDKEKQKKVIKYAGEALKCLQDNLPGLLSNADFFRIVFH